MATIHFYQMHYFTPQKKKKRVPGDEPYEKKYLPEENKKVFKEIIKKKIDNNNCILLEELPDWCLLQILEYGVINSDDSISVVNDIDSAQYIFGRIGKRKDLRDLQKRNRRTFSPNPIELDKDEDIEVFTYVYFIFEKEKVSVVYLTSLSAPNINMVQELYRSRNGKIEINPVITKDVTKVLKQKDVVNAFSYKLNLPDPSELDLSGIGLPEKEFEKLRNHKSTEIVVTIKAERNQNLFKEKSSIKKLADNIYMTHRSKVKDCLCNAKDMGGTLIPYHFLNNEFIAKATFNFKHGEDEHEKEVKKVLLKKYLIHREELLQYMS